MRRFLNIAIASVLLLAATASCESPGKGINAETTNGKVSLSLSPSGTFDPQEIVKSSTVDVSNFIVELYRSNGELFARYEKYSEIPKVVAVPSGSYKIVSKSCEEVAAAFSMPYYYGEKMIEVIRDENTVVDLVCKLGNAKISMSYSSTFLQKYQDFIVTVQNSGGSIDFIPSESRSGFVKCEPFMVKIMAKLYGDTDYKEVYRESFVAEIANHYLITINISDVGNFGKPGITVDATVINKDVSVVLPGDEDLGNGGKPEWPFDPENPLPGPDPDPEVTSPTVIGVGFDISQPVLIDDSDITEGVCTIPVKVDIQASKGGIANLFVTIDSPDITGDFFLDLFDGSFTFDLANLEDRPKTKGLLEDVGLITPGMVIKDASSFFLDVTSFMGLLSSNGESGDKTSQTHKFHIKVVDGQGNEKELTLTVVRSI